LNVIIIIIIKNRTRSTKRQNKTEEYSLVNNLFVCDTTSNALLKSM